MNRFILITGASRGIGREIARTLSEEGDLLLLTGFRHPEALSEIRKEAEANGSRCEIFSGDLGKNEECERLFETVDRIGRPLDVLINNAGISEVSLIQDSSDGTLQRLLDVNLSSVVRLTKLAVKRMLPEKSGRILNISSDFGLYGASMESEYALTKGGIHAFTKSVAKELAPSGIVCNALALGAIDTEMNARLSAEEKAALSESIPMGRFGSPSEVGKMVSLLLRAPLYLTGAVIPFDGGWF